MYIAKSASLRTADLSRQVGAAIFSEDGEVISLGSNEVPKAGGGTYWTDDPKDARDYKSGFDPNDIRQREIISRPAQQASWWRASFAGTSFSKRCIRNCISTDGLKGGALHPKFNDYGPAGIWSNSPRRNVGALRRCQERRTCTARDTLLHDVSMSYVCQTYRCLRHRSGSLFGAIPEELCI
jgi:hypothetical protein